MLRTPAASSTSFSGVPVQRPIALQPSTQSCRVVWLRTGIAPSCDSDSDSGRATMPSTTSRQSAKPFASSAA